MLWVMPNRVVDCLLAGGRLVALGVLLCGKLCLLSLCGACEGNEITKISNQERTLKELKCLFFYSLFTWTTVFLAPLVISFNDFLIIFSSSI
jgi:hypothetical protein